jgi:PleD family two-component response regulator
MSAGIAAMEIGSAESLSDLMRRADAALYSAKAAGKGRVVRAEPDR